MLQRIMLLCLRKDRVVKNIAGKLHFVLFTVNIKEILKKFIMLGARKSSDL